MYAAGAKSPAALLDNLFSTTPPTVAFGSVNGTDSRFHSPQQTGTTQDSPKPSRMRQNLTNLDTRTVLPI